MSRLASLVLATVLEAAEAEAEERAFWIFTAVVLHRFDATIST